LVVTIIGCIAFGESPLKPVQIICVTIFMDTLASYALATYPPADNILIRKPNSKK
jgi:magnesium-transporting ATPase (P-type)